MPIVYLKTGQRYPCISLNPLLDSVIMFADIIQKTLEHWRDMLICRSEKIPMILRLTWEFSNCKYMYLFSLYSPSLYIISVLVLAEQIFIKTLIRLCTCIIIIYASLESCFLTDIAFKFVRKLLVYRTLYRKYCSRSFIHNFPWTVLNKSISRAGPDF